MSPLYPNTQQFWVFLFSIIPNDLTHTKLALKKVQGFKRGDNPCEIRKKIFQLENKRTWSQEQKPTATRSDQMVQLLPLPNNEWLEVKNNAPA